MTRKPLLALALLTTLALGSAASAQEARAKVLGKVTDPTGAIIPGAKVTVINVATNVKTEITTDNDGNYQALALPIGTYKVIVEKDGFKTTTTDQFTLEINQESKLNVALTVGSKGETVEVTDVAAAIETQNATIGQSITSRPIINLPLNGRNVLDLATLQPGVAESSPNSNAAGTYTIAGGRPDSVTFLLDGGNNNNLLSNGVVANPNPDAIAEFRILENNYSAEYGRNGGGVISVVQKSGTNQIHGSAFDYVRNDAFNANSYFNKRTGTPRDVLKRNQFGATVGGPISIPKVVDGRDKFFWFFSYQGQRQTHASSNLANVFTTQEIGGDFSKSGPGGTPDPGVVSFLQANPYYQPNAALAAQAIIDPTRFASVAQKYLSAKLIPSSANGQLNSVGSEKADNNEFAGKFDFVLTGSDRLSVTLNSRRAPTTDPFSGGGSIANYPTLYSRNAYFTTISETHSFTPTLLNDFRFTGQRAYQLQAKPLTKLPTPQQLGTNITPDDPTGPTRLGFLGHGLELGFSPQGPTTLINNTFAYQDNVSWVKGRHSMKFGGQFSPYQNNTVYDFYVNGEFYFYGPDTGVGSGNDFADFLVGAPDELLQFGKAPSNIRSKATYVFGQDEWRVTDKLTLTYGLRYEYSTPKVDTQGRSFSIIPGHVSQRFVNAPVGLVFPGDPGAPKGANFPDKNDFAPRFGFAYDPSGHGKTSIRGGFGVFYDILKGEDNLQFNGQAPFFGFEDIFPGGGVATTAELNYMSDPFTASGAVNTFPSKPPAKNIDFDANGFLPFGGGGVYFVDPHLRTPYVMQYNLGVQQDLGHGFTGEAAYVGSLGRKLTSLVDNNAFILGTKTRILNAQPTGSNGVAPFYSYTDTFRNVSSSEYNSLQASLRKRLSQGAFADRFGNTYFTLGYTFAKNIDNASGFREASGRTPYYNTDQFRAVSDQDIKHRLVFSGGWDLPFAHYFGNNRLASGWSLYPIVTWRTGFPLDVRAGLSRSRRKPGPSGAGDSNLVRADLVGNSVNILDPKKNNASSGSGALYFSPSNFDNTALLALNGTNFVPAPSQRTYGTTPRNFFRGPGRSNMDLALSKVTNLYGDGRVKFEFRAEAFNLFNNVQFQQPDTSITSPTFGQILSTYDPRILQLAARITF